MKHLDLFSGIGGFAYAIDQVWDDVEHIFCDNEPFAQKVLKKHWLESEIYDDIRAITDTRRKHGRKGRTESPHGEKTKRGATAEEDKRLGRIDILTGGFPCQPFSQAGSRRGTSDDRYLWPEMLRVIRLTKPQWVVAENVRGLLTLEQGVVFEQVCADLEASGYEVQPFIIPAVAVNAPHRRDRIWFIGHTKHYGLDGSQDTKGRAKRSDSNKEGSDELRQPKGTDSLWETTNANSKYTRLERKQQRQAERQHGQPDRTRSDQRPDWNKDWLEVATWASRVDDGLPDRSHRLKALGNAIVPQVAIEIMKGIKAQTHD